ncbi:MAG TPA: AMIN domain-containing protein [Longimicrobiales bacterium]
MIPILLTVLLGAVAPEAGITGFSVAPTADRTEVVIHVEGNVSIKNFALTNPHRVVVDITGANQGSMLRFSDIRRGGVTGLRASQYQRGVVRVVLDLTQRVNYHIEHKDGEIHISFPNPEGSFEPWSSAPAAPVRMATKASEPAPRPAAPRVEAPRPSPAEVAAQQERLQPRVTVSFDNEPIMNVLLTFSEFANRSIVAHPTVRAINVTADVKNQPWDVALEAILSAHGMAARENSSGIIIVEPLTNILARQQTEPPETRAFYIKYASADTLVRAIAPLLTPSSGKATVNPNANALLITDTRSALERVAPIIEQMDVRTPQVTISAKIIFIDRTALEDLGFVYDLKDSRGSQLNTVVQGWNDANGNGVFESGEQTSQNLISLGGNSVAALANANFRVASPSLQLVSTLLLGRHSLITFIDALQSVNLTDIQAAPSITVMDHREARIQVGERTPVRTIDAGAVSGEGARSTVRTENTGIILRVTPHIVGNSQVMLELHAERSNIAAAPSDLGFTFQTQEAQTQILVDNGETAVIGGLTIIEKTNARAGIPILMNLPVVGALFRQELKRENKRDLLIMVTPHIVRDGTP